MWTPLNLTICWIFAFCVVIRSIECTGNLTRSGLHRYRFARQADCTGFRCRNGECVDEDVKCDGTVDCSDGSDETDSCKDLQCRGRIFRCKYGACISKKLECDGKKDCRDGSDETSPNCVDIKSTKCNREQFKCKNGQCIDIDNKCDGTPHCSDLSDETAESCLKLICPGHTFKCKYGACISRKGVCNGISECFDGSDESRETCGDTFITPSTTKKPTQPTRPATPPTVPSGKPRPPNIYTKGSCILPPKAEKGSWSVWPSAEYDYQPGDLVSLGTTIMIKCMKGYIVSGTENEVALSICAEHTGWSIVNPKCIRICSPIETSSITFAQCKNDGVEISCKAPTEGTIAKFKCPLFYELSTDDDIRTCADGTWNEEKPHCKPVCGQKTALIKEMVIGGKHVKKGYYPWTIALYKQYNETFFDLVCGGTLISERVIVTAAHCVTDLEGNTRPKELYRVAAGKYFRKYDEKNDEEAEFSEVEEILVYSRYKAYHFHFVGDIALIIAKESFNASHYIQRICMDWDPYSIAEGKLVNTEGIVTGWGYTKRGANPSEILKEISLPYVDFDTCYSGTPEEYRSYINDDKMCAGFLDKGVGVCEGDSGGGLAFQAPDKKNRFYLRGIVSISPSVNGTCNEYKYAFYTKVSAYIRFILPIVQRYRPKASIT